MNIVVKTMDRFYQLVLNQQGENNIEGMQLRNIANTLNITTLDLQKIMNILIEKDMIMLFGDSILKGKISNKVYIRLTDKAFEYYKNK